MDGWIFGVFVRRLVVDTIASSLFHLTPQENDMSILVQRQFCVASDDRKEFERQSREGVWVNMRYNGNLQGDALPR